MKKVQRIVSVALVAIACLHITQQAGARVKHPNIILVFIDDMAGVTSPASAIRP